MSKKEMEARRRQARERSAAMAREGLRMEDRVERLLQRLVAEGRFDAYTRHKHFSRADRQGKDFTVWRERQHWSFGVTVSSRSACRAYTNRPRWPTYWFWPEITDEAIQRIILSLAEDPRFPPEEH